uniref:Uncharacterized protein n=1 Tax=Anguilla anguilla TaxID=7936 RepID=A0A0E9XQ69_ANGAN
MRRILWQVHKNTMCSVVSAKIPPSSCTLVLCNLTIPIKTFDSPAERRNVGCF